MPAMGHRLPAEFERTCAVVLHWFRFAPDCAATRNDGTTDFVPFVTAITFVIQQWLLPLQSSQRDHLVFDCFVLPPRSLWSPSGT